MNFRALIESMAIRERLANLAGRTFHGKRDLYRALGYKRELFPPDYRSRFRRNEVANRIVKLAPKATWRGGCDVIEDHDPEVVTPFEKAVVELDKRLKLWNTFYKADVLARIGRYGIILIGAPGELNEPLESVSGPNDIVYLQPYPEEDAKIQFYEVDRKSPRFGLPVFYQVNRTSITAAGALNSSSVGTQVHWTRVLHVSEGLLDDRIFGEPALECVWNRLDDLEKVSGAGPEAFWRRADGGMQVDIDPTMDIDEPELEALKKQIEAYEHEQKRTLTTRGTKINRLGSDVADIASTVTSLMSLISAGTGIPQRVLTGSEQGKLAAKQDKATFDNQITDRQNEYAGPMMVRPLIDRFIELGALPAPEEGTTQYEVEFAELRTMDDEQKAAIAVQWGSLNKPNSPLVVLPDEIRTNVLGLEPLAEVASAEDLARIQAGYDTTQEPTVAARNGGAETYAHVHRAADRFRAGAKGRRLRGVRDRKTVARPIGPVGSAY